MGIAINVLGFLVALIVLVAVHEFGHFFVARLCGVRVLRFSIGFGRVIWRRYDRHGTEFALASIPLGGYVKMLDERETEVPEEQRHESFNRKTVWQRMAIVAAGPAINIVFAILVFWGLLLGGERDLVPIIGKVEPGSIAAHAGLDEGQEILSVDGVPTPTQMALRQQLVRRLGESGSMEFTLRYPESNLEYSAEVLLDNWLRATENPDPLAGLGVSLYVPPVPPRVGEVLPGSPAEAAGMQVGDLVVSADALPMNTAEDWINYVKSRANQSIQLELERGSQRIFLQVTPESIEEKGVSYGRVGVGIQAPHWPEEMIRTYEYSIAGALVAGVKRTWSTTEFIFLSIKKLVTREISHKNLSGPVGIAKVAGASARSGLRSYLGFLALLSVFLAVFNLLPIPVLDGGHLLYYLIEAIKGSPVSERVQLLGYQVGLFLIIGLSLMAFYFDILRL